MIGSSVKQTLMLHTFGYLAAPNAVNANVKSHARIYRWVNIFSYLIVDKSENEMQRIFLELFDQHWHDITSDSRARATLLLLYRHYIESLQSTKGK